MNQYTLFVHPVQVEAEDEEDAIAKAKTLLQHQLATNSLEFEEVVNEEEEQEAQAEIDEKEILDIERNERGVRNDQDD